MPRWPGGCSFAVAVDSSTFEPLVARALELQIGKARVVVALDQVDRMIETVCTPMPMAHRLVRGIGFDEQAPDRVRRAQRQPAELAPRSR